MPRPDKTEKKKQVKLDEAATGTKNIKKFFSISALLQQYSVGAEHAAN